MRDASRLMQGRRGRVLIAALWMLGSAHAALPGQAVITHFPQPGLTASQLGIIVNDDDPDSVAIATYYQEKRGVPPANLIHVRFKPGRSTLSREEFMAMKRQVDRTTPDDVEAYALTWALPYRVDCMSITSAFAFGFSPDFCAGSCQPTQSSPYFNSSVTHPHTTLKFRPTMSLAATTVREAKKLIDRGIAADGSNPAGTAYLVSTDDKARNVRAAGYTAVQAQLGAVLPIDLIHANALTRKKDVMFYFTGLPQVPSLDSNTFLPGAMADHLTSAGGVLVGGTQMSSLRWLEAGATGSYGAVTEPCNFPAKFPVPGVLMAHYLQGETLIEAYWKSVQMPGQGIFIGEPLARPFAGITVDARAGGVTLSARLLPPGLYDLQAAPSMMGPYRTVGRIPIAPGAREVRLDTIPPLYYRFERRSEPAPMR